MDKIEEAQEILKALGLPEAQQNRICALTLLALSNIGQDDSWQTASAASMTLSKDIIEFVNEKYKAGYKPNTRESFRKNALKPFVDNNVALLNPDDPSLTPTSSKTHYSLSGIALKAIRSYKTSDWDNAVEEFKEKQFPENKPSSLLIHSIRIDNYKSIFEEKIQLGRFNVFIGANGCGKSNLLEAVAMAGASIADELNFEGLYSRGVRIARPNLTSSSFLQTPQKDAIDITIGVEHESETKDISLSIAPENPSDIYSKWINQNNQNSPYSISWIKNIIENTDFSDDPKLVTEKIIAEYEKRTAHPKNSTITPYYSYLAEYGIFDLNTKSLRGVIPADSRKTPLGLNGEGLDLLIANFNSYEKEFLNECSFFFDWLESIFSDKDDRAKNEGLKVGRSISTLYFTDKYMQKKNNTFSAENSNEGILHVLFYIALFISNKTPNFFAIDNIETALNPKLCEKLVKTLAKLAKERGKQVLVTTHNPAILDGLNLADDNQRLFEVYRNSEGKTKTRRIKFKDDLSDKTFKLSEMWLKGVLGAIPKNF